MMMMLPWRRGNIVKKDLSKVLMPDHPMYTEGWNR